MKDSALHSTSLHFNVHNALESIVLHSVALCGNWQAAKSNMLLGVNQCLVYTIQHNMSTLYCTQCIHCTVHYVYTTMCGTVYLYCTVQGIYTFFTVQCVHCSSPTLQGKACTLFSKTILYSAGLQSQMHCSLDTFLC